VPTFIITISANGRERVRAVHSFVEIATSEKLTRWIRFAAHHNAEL
jgi:hypothetical protein